MDQKKVMGLFEYDGKSYGWAFPTVQQTIAAASRREVMCQGMYGVMLSSPIPHQRDAAANVFIITDLESHVVQYPEGVEQGFGHLDVEELRKAHTAMSESLKKFRESKASAGADEGGGSGAV